MASRESSSAPPGELQTGGEVLHHRRPELRQQVGGRPGVGVIVVERPRIIGVHACDDAVIVTQGHARDMPSTTSSADVFLASRSLLALTTCAWHGSAEWMWQRNVLILKFSFVSPFVCVSLFSV